MALIFSGVSTIGRFRLNQNLLVNTSYILLFPSKPLDFVRYEGVWELLRLNTPLNRFVRIVEVPMWVDSHLIAGTNIPNVNHRFSWVFRFDGVPFELHTT